MASFMSPAAAPPTALGKHRVLSSTSGLRVSPLVLGGMSLGDAFASFMGGMSKEEVFSLLDAYHAAGGNFLDTANGYQDGQSESYIGEWMAARGAREHMVVATKYTFQYKSVPGERGPEWTNHWGNHRRSLKISLRDSMARLQTDWIDVLYVHFWDYTTSVQEVMNALHALVEQGTVLYLGISDTPAWVVAACNTYALAHGKTPFSVYQGRWNVLVRDLEREILPMVSHFNMALVPWDVLGGGRFKSAAQIDARKKEGGELRTVTGEREQSKEEVRVSEALEKVAKELGTESLTAVALAYVRSKYARVFPLVGGRKVEHLHDNIGSLDLSLSQGQIEYLEGVSPIDLGFPSNFIGQDYHLTGQPSMLAAAQGPVDLA